MKHILSSLTASISELKRNPTALINQAEGAPVAILNHNVPAAYLIPADTYERLLERLDDAELGELVKQRAHEKPDSIEVNLDDL